MNHEVYYTCPSCGYDFDARTEWVAIVGAYHCPCCGKYITQEEIDKYTKRYQP